MNEPIDEIEGIIEEGYARMMWGFYQLRTSGQHQREYDSIGHVINLLMQDRDYIRNTHKVDI